jgi:hypothetical protein
MSPRDTADRPSKLTPPASGGGPPNLLDQLSHDSSPKVDANEIRWTGEEADGKRGEVDYVVVWKDGPRGRRPGLVPLDEAKAKNLEVIAAFVVQTPFAGEGLRNETPLTIACKGKQVPLGRESKSDPNKVELPDAIFLTQSAFQKFVIPYYARMRSTGQLDKLRKKYFTDKRCMALLHFEPSEDEKFPSFETLVRGLMVQGNSVEIEPRATDQEIQDSITSEDSEAY